MKKLTLKEAIKKKCFDCSGFSWKEVENCPIEDCPLYPYRLGKKQLFSPKRGAHKDYHN